MSLATNVFRRGGRYAFRARVPNDLVARFGRSEIIRSLKTTDPGMARRYASRVGASLYVLWDKVRSDLMLSRERIDEIVRGARLNEIGQLLRSDVREIEEAWCFQFTEEAEGDQKRFKTEAARRIVPVHPELVRLGFIDFVGKASTGPRLFPHWKRGEDGYYSSVFSKWFGRFLTSVDLKDPRLVFHSFRHGFKDALRRAMVEERIQDAIMGHEPSM